MVLSSTLLVKWGTVRCVMLSRSEFNLDMLDQFCYLRCSFFSKFIFLFDTS